LGVFERKTDGKRSALRLFPNGSRVLGTQGEKSAAGYAAYGHPTWRSIKGDIASPKRGGGGDGGASSGGEVKSGATKKAEESCERLSRLKEKIQEEITRKPDLSTGDSRKGGISSEEKGILVFEPDRKERKKKRELAFGKNCFANKHASTKRKEEGSVGTEA